MRDVFELLLFLILDNHRRGKRRSSVNYAVSNGYEMVQLALLSEVGNDVLEGRFVVHVVFLDGLVVVVVVVVARQMHDTAGSSQSLSQKVANVDRVAFHQGGFERGGPALRARINCFSGMVVIAVVIVIVRLR